MFLDNFFKDKQVLITGNTGFKGAWLSLLLHRLGAKLVGVSRPPKDELSLYGLCGMNSFTIQHYFDILDYDSLKETLETARPDIIFHLAAQSITLNAYETPLATFRVNGIGTANVLEVVRNYARPCLLVLITSDKCYRNNEWPWGYRENDVLAGLDPYSASKSVAEIIFNSYHHSYFKHENQIRVSTCRAGNVIGGGDWNPHRIIPDCIRAWKDKTPLNIRHPEAVRPWNYVLDVLAGYLHVAYELQRGGISGEAFNFGPKAQNEISVQELVKRLWEAWDDHSFEPFTIAENPGTPFEHKNLKLNSDKAQQMLSWTPRTDISTALADISRFYRDIIADPNVAYDMAMETIDRFLDGY